MEDYKKPFYTLVVGNDEYHLKLITRTKIMAEEKLGFSLLEAMGQKSTYAKTFAVILWAALQKFHSGMNLEKTYDLVDELEENDADATEKYNIIFEIFKVSGFFTREELEEFQKKEEQEKLETQKKEEIAEKKTPVKK